jgi:hypothetical protein
VNNVAEIHLPVFFISAMMVLIINRQGKLNWFAGPIPSQCIPVVMGMVTDEEFLKFLARVFSQERCAEHPHSGEM